jgi:ribokinase
LRLAVVGHVEWVEFLRVDRIPAGGEIAHAADPFEDPAGGGAVAAVQLARLADGSELFTALGEDEHAARTRERLRGLGVSVHAATRDGATRRAITMVDAGGERTITTVGDRLAAAADDPLPWENLASADGVYFTAGDAGALRAARDSRVLVATPRAGEVLRQGEVQLDALVYSDDDELEREAAGKVDPPPDLVVATRGSDGGGYQGADGSSGSWAAARLPGPAVDSYGAGDSFAAALCWALASGAERAAAIRVAALAGAAAIAGRGPFGSQLSREEALAELG